MRRLFLEVCSVCFGLVGALLLLTWYYSPSKATEEVTRCLPVKPPTAGGSVTPPPNSCTKETYTVVVLVYHGLVINSSIILSLNEAIVSCAALTLAAAFACRWRPHLPGTIRRASALVGAASAFLSVWALGSWYGLFVTAGPEGAGGGRLVSYAHWLFAGPGDVLHLGALLVLATSALVLSRLDGRPAGAALTKILLEFLLPLLLGASTIIFLFDYREFFLQFNEFTGTGSLPSTVLGVPLYVTNASALFGSLLLLLLLPEVLLNVGRPT